MLAAVIAAGISYWAGLHYVPNVFIIVAGFLTMGLFAGMEHELLEKHRLPGTGSHDARLVLLHVARTVV